MKILTLFFTYGTSLEDWHKNGTLDREIGIYKKLLDHFDRIYFVTYGQNDARLSARLPREIIVLPKKWKLNNLFYSLLIPFAYKKEIQESAWLKTNQMLGSWSAVLAKIFFRKKLNVRTGYTESLFGRTGMKKIFVTIAEWMAYRNCTFATVTSADQEEYLKKRYHAKNIFIVPNGINTEIFKPTENKTYSEKTRLLFVGRLHPEKNILNLIEAIKEIKNISLKIIGNGPLEKNILELKEKYNLNLEIIPSVPNNELPKIYNEADIYVQPSIYEGNPKTILEAMSCGLPVIASDIKGINDVISHKENGYLCETRIESIKNATIEVMGDKNLQKKIGANARKFIEENYDLNKIIEKETVLYEDNE